jgi:ribosomal protein S18 acetylase RimI-like enzyme
LKKFFLSYGKISIENQTGYGVGKPLKGVAFWRAPHQKEISINLKSLSIFLPLLFSYYPIGYFRARPLNQQTDALHQLHAIQPHYYLENIGVLPAEQGKGFASQLMRPILERADAEHVIVYTDTSTRSNVSFYEHFGFECVEERSVEDTGVKIYAMRRDIPC